MQFNYIESVSQVKDDPDKHCTTFTLKTLDLMSKCWKIQLRNSSTKKNSFKIVQRSTNQRVSNKFNLLTMRFLIFSQIVAQKKAQRKKKTSTEFLFKTF